MALFNTIPNGPAGKTFGPVSGGASTSGAPSYYPTNLGPRATPSASFLQGVSNYAQNSDPTVGVQAFLGRLGISPFGGFGNFLSGMSPRLGAGYTVASLDNPNLDFRDYLSNQLPTLQSDYDYQRGVFLKPIARLRVL
jgi:hypothetical protein